EDKQIFFLFWLLAASVCCRGALLARMPAEYSAALRDAKIFGSDAAGSGRKQEILVFLGALCAFARVSSSLSQRRLLSLKLPDFHDGLDSALADLLGADRQVLPFRGHPEARDAR